MPVSNSNFVLPNYSGRVFWGRDAAGTWGYISAGLPNIKGTFTSTALRGGQQASGVFSYAETPIYSFLVQGSTLSANMRLFTMDASTGTGSIYSDSVTTVQPPAIKVRVKTRYK